MRTISFLFGYCKMLLQVTFGLRSTDYPLNLVWRWRHPDYFNL